MTVELRPDILKTCKSGKKKDFDSAHLDERNGKLLAMKSGHKSKTIYTEE